MRTVLIDFDNTLHSYISGWVGKTNIPDPPHPGAIEWLRELLDDPEIEPVIFTTRVHVPGKNTADSLEAKQAIRNWLVLNGLSPDQANEIRITCVKESAVLIVDDRAFNFCGRFPSRGFIHSFEPKIFGDPQPSDFGATFDVEDKG